jgi:hypothetical protein
MGSENSFGEATPPAGSRSFTAPTSSLTPMATFSARTASPPPPSRTPAGSPASGRYASIASRTTLARGPLTWDAPPAPTHRSIRDGLHPTRPRSRRRMRPPRCLHHFVSHPGARARLFTGRISFCARETSQHILDACSSHFAWSSCRCWPSRQQPAVFRGSAFRHASNWRPCRRW